MATKQLFTNNASSLLAGNITDVAATLTVTATEGGKFPSPATADEYFLITIAVGNSFEVVKCTSRTGDVLTIVRAQESTVAQGWSIGALIELRYTKGPFTNHENFIYNLQQSTGSSLVGTIQSGTTPTYGWAIRTVAAKEGDWISVKDVKCADGQAVMGDGSHDDTTGIQSALTYAGTLTNATVYFPRGTYKVTAKLSFSGTRISLIGTGKWQTTISNAIVANPADPVFEATATRDYLLIEGLRIIGNGLAAGSGNGHAIAVIGTTGDWISDVYIRDCEIQSLLGNGKDNTGTTMGAAGIYAYGVLNLKVQSCEFTACQYGIVLDGTTSLPPNKVLISACTFDTISLQGIRGARVENMVVDGMCIFNAIGGGAATDAGIWLQNATLVNIIGNRFKNINGNHIAANQSSNCTSINIVGNYLYSFYSTAIIDVGTANEATNIHNNDVLWDSTVTNGVGILISNPAGWIGLGADIAGNRFLLGGAATVTNAIDINNGTNGMRGLVIRNNVIGQQTTPSGAQGITTGINLRGAGGITAPLLLNNVLNMVSPGTLTTGINLPAGVTGAFVMNNVINGAGTPISNVSAKSTVLSAGDWTFVGNMGFFGTAAQSQLTSGANLTNNVTSGGTDNTIANFTDLTTYANDSAAIRNNIYQLARKLKQVNDAFRAYGLLT